MKRPPAAGSPAAGHALLVALFVLVLTLAAGALIASSLGFRMHQVRHEARGLHLTALTDAALAQALAELAHDPGYGGTDSPYPLDDGAFEVWVQRIGSNRAVVRVRATYGGGARAARADVTLFPVLEVTRWQPEAHRLGPEPLPIEED